MDTILEWINTCNLKKFISYINSLRNVNSVLVYDEEYNLNILHIISGYKSPFRDKILLKLIEESNKKNFEPKLDINFQSGPGNDLWTAAHIAACWGNHNTLKLLLERGSNPNILDKNGLSVLDVARAYDQFPSILVLRKLTIEKIDQIENLENLNVSKNNINSKNNTIETVFYSLSDNESLVKVDAAVQTSILNEKELSVSKKDENLLKSSDKQNSKCNSLSKIDKIKKLKEDLEKKKKINKNLINENKNISLNEDVLLNGIKKSFFYVSSNYEKITENHDSKKINRNLFKEFSNSNNKSNITIEEKLFISSDDDSIDPFQIDSSISTIHLEDNKELYIDEEFGINFLNETKNILINKNYTNNKDSDTFEIEETLTNKTQFENVSKLNDLEIRQLLIKNGMTPGPITSSTRKIYLIKLKKLNKNHYKNEILFTKQIQNLSLSKIYCRPLNELFLNKFSFKQAQSLETEFLKQFENQASSKIYFNYLLLDPRLTNNLAKRAQEEEKFNHSLFKQFIKSIFYIGKGQGNRPFMHLYEAALYEQEKQFQKTSSKINRILDIWNSNNGVISLHCFHSSTNIEALTRECFMIDTIGIDNLTNIKLGKNGVKNLFWTQYKKDYFGAYLLYKAYNILLVNGERQIRKADIKT